MNIMIVSWDMTVFDLATSLEVPAANFFYHGGGV
jgi:hypothetical protein